MKQTLNNSIEINKKNKGCVGADDPTVYAESVESKRSNRFMCVRPILKRNTQKGITLVALVITIIILLILAMVSIKIAIDGGLITKASKANRYTYNSSRKRSNTTRIFSISDRISTKRNSRTKSRRSKSNSKRRQLECNIHKNKQ